MEKSAGDRLLFGNKICKKCGRMLPPGNEEDLCRSCQERALFEAVREYIRQNDVTEQDVVQQFGISKWKVREWIKDGRIEYQEDNGHMFQTPDLGRIDDRASKRIGYSAPQVDDSSKWRSNINGNRY